MVSLSPGAQGYKKRVQGTLSCETSSVWQVATFTSWGLSSPCVLDKVWSHSEMSSDSLWFLPICKHTSHFVQKIQIAFNFLAMRRMSFRHHRCSEE